MSQTTKNPADAQQRAGRRSVDEFAQRSDRRVRWTVLAVVVALLATLAAVALLSRGADPAGTTEGTVGGFTAVPAGVDDVTGAVPVAPDVTPKPGAPQLDIWEDSSVRPAPRPSSWPGPASWRWRDRGTRPSTGG